MEGMSRRGFIGRGGALMGAIGLAGIAPIEALAGPAGALAPERRRRYVALVEGLSRSEHVAVDAGRAREYADRLASDYADGTDDYRHEVDVLLDSLDYVGSSHRSGSFEARGRQDRLEHLRGRLDDYRPLDADRDVPRGWCVRHVAGLVLANFDDNIGRYGPWTFQI